MLGKVGRNLKIWTIFEWISVRRLSVRRRKARFRATGRNRVPDTFIVKPLKRITYEIRRILHRTAERAADLQQGGQQQEHAAHSRQLPVRAQGRRAEDHRFGPRDHDDRHAESRQHGAGRRDRRSGQTDDRFAERVLGATADDRGQRVDVGKSRSAGKRASWPFPALPD